MSLLRPCGLAAVAALLTASAADAAEIVSFANTPGGLYSTGISGSMYTYVGSGPATGMSGTAVAGDPMQFPVQFYNSYPGSMANSAASNWILTHSNSNPSGSFGDVAGGTYNFSTTFTLPAGAQSASVSGSAAGDDTISAILLNNVPITPPYSNTLGGFQGAPFSITSGFQPGLNTLTFVVQNGAIPADGNPVGLNVRIDAASAVVPEPATIVAFAGLTLAGGFVARRRKAVKA